MKFEVHVGDRWDDGHGKYETFVFETNDKAKVDAALKDINENLDFDSWFQEYEDRTISSSQYEELIEFLPEASEFFEETINWKTNLPTGDYTILEGAEGYIDLFVALIKKTDPSIELSKINDNLPSIELGGYGLFYS